jgi:enoyl-CoA hydratase/carnithine racemase
VSDWTSSLETILVDRPAEGIVVATLNRPDRLNAMNNTMFREFEVLARGVDAEAATRVLVITGAGRGFCAGYDLDDAELLSSLSAMDMLSQQELAARGLLALRGIKQPIIAAVNGAAAGGGLSLSLASDIRLASPAAKFNAAFVRIGLSAGDLGVSWLMPRLVGPAKTAEICYTGRIVSAEEAEEIGLVNKVVPAESLLDEALAMAAQIVANSPAGVQLSKRALQNNLEIGSYSAALELENRGQALLTRGADMVEALTAFKAKRAPQFTGA